MKKSVLILPLLAILLIAARACFFVVDQNEQVVVLQFGKPVGEPITKPGLYTRKPFIQELRRFDKRVQVWDGNPNQIPTLGREFIFVDTTARWQIVDPLRFLQSVRDVNGARKRLDDIIDSVIRDRISNYELEEIVRSKDFVAPKPGSDLFGAPAGVNLDKPRKGREELMREIHEEAARSMPDYGIRLIDVRIKRLGYTQEVQNKVEERMISERQRIAEQFRSEGLGKSAEIDGETERMTKEIMSRAQRQAEEIRGKADAEATRIYGEAFGKDPEFYAFFRTLESYPQTIGPNTTLMLSGKSEFFRYLESTTPPAAAVPPQPAPAGT